jgi:tape measure domain-containing protein
VIVGADISAALAGLRSVSNAVAGFAQKVGSTALGVFGGNLLTNAFGAAKDAIGGAITDSLKLNAAYETTQIGLNTLLGTAGTGFQLDLRAFARDTPFAFEQLAGLSRQLLGTGFAAKSIIPLLTDVGNVSSAMGAGSEGVDRITRALQQMKGIGKVQRGELNQLSEVGINGLDILAKFTGKSVADINDALDKGAIGADTFIVAFQQFARQGKFVGAMDAQAKSAGGIWENLMETLADAKAAVLFPLFEALKELGANVLAFTRTATFTEWINAARDAVAGFLQPFGTMLVMAGNIAGAHGLGLLQAALIATELVLGQTFGPQTAGLFHGFIEGIKRGGQWLIDNGPKFFDWLGTTLPGAVETGATKLGDFIGWLTTNLPQGLDTVITKFNEWKAWLDTEVGPMMGRMVAEVLGALKTIELALDESLLRFASLPLIGAALLPGVAAALGPQIAQLKTDLGLNPGAPFPAGRTAWAGVDPIAGGPLVASAFPPAPVTVTFTGPINASDMSEVERLAAMVAGARDQAPNNLVDLPGAA